MKKSNYTEEQITFALKQAELCTPVGEVCRKLGVTEQTFYRWKKKHDAQRHEAAKTTGRGKREAQEADSRSELG